MNHFLALRDYPRDILRGLLSLTARMKRNPENYRSILAGRQVGLVFEKPSTRTRVSFESGVYQLGGNPLVLSGRDLQLGRGEPIRDTSRVFSRYLDLIMIRTFGQEIVEEMARYSSVPVINGLTDQEHPCQALSDFFTLGELFGDIAGKRVVFVGDGNNMARSLLWGTLAFDCEFVFCGPAGYSLSTQEIAEVNARGGRASACTGSVWDAVAGADVIYTDVWVSMGQEADSQLKKNVFQPYQLNEALLEKAPPGAVVQHCLPAHRGEEITDGVFEAHADAIFRQAENRLHTQKAIMSYLLGYPLPD